MASRLPSSIVILRGAQVEILAEERSFHPSLPEWQTAANVAGDLCTATHEACADGQAVLRDQRRHVPRYQQLISCRGFAADAGSEAPKAAALIIGNEILSGSITDTNTPWLAKLLHRCHTQPLVAPYHTSSCSMHAKSPHPS